MRQCSCLVEKFLRLISNKDETLNILKMALLIKLSNIAKSDGSNHQII